MRRWKTFTALSSYENKPERIGGMMLVNSPQVKKREKQLLTDWLTYWRVFDSIFCIDHFYKLPSDCVNYEYD